MATSDLTVINAAATRTGNDPITSLTTGGAVGLIASNNYEDVVKAELSLHPWKRSSKIAQLSRIDAATLGDPPEPWTAAYELPPDLIEIRSISVLGSVIDYEVHGDKILCYAGEADNVILKYVWRAPESQWPAWFREGITRRMEAVFLRGIGERHAEAADRDKAADQSFARARNRDSQSMSSRDPVASPTLQARGGTAGILHTNGQWPR